MSWPTDVKHLRKTLVDVTVFVGRAADAHGLAGWRQRRHLIRKTNRLHARVRTAKLYHLLPDRVEVLLSRARALVAKAKESHGLLPLRK